ncbi:MAG: hypothetical protein ACRDU0_09270, partial [Mycobacterium sp.]
MHEAFASLTVEGAPTKLIAKRPPKPLDELPPEQKPDGDVTWIGGYWAWDDDRNDFLWVSGTWRVAPPGKSWIAGYWRETGDNWQWVPGFWTTASQDTNQEMTYLPNPPAPPAEAPPGQPPVAESFWVPGNWVWTGTTYGWRAGYWARVEPGYVWIPAHYSWTPGGYLFVAGYWDLAVRRRGILYAPVVVDPGAVTVSFSYTPACAVPDALIVDTLFVRPAYCHYYFGDYYAPAYRDLGFQSAFVYSGNHYDAVIAYERYERRADPTWLSVQINLFGRRSAGLAPVPPRTFVQNTTVVNNVTNVTNVTNNTNNITRNNVTNNNVTNNNTNNAITRNNTTTNNNVTNNTTNNKMVWNGPTLGTTTQVAAAQGVKTVPLNITARRQVKQQAVAIQQVALQRTVNEAPRAGAVPNRPRTAALTVPKTGPPAFVGKPANGTAATGQANSRAITPAANTPNHAMTRNAVSPAPRGANNAAAHPNLPSVPVVHPAAPAARTNTVPPA